MNALSPRLEAVLSLAPEGPCVADIGTDHGYLAIALVERGIAAHVIAMDVREGPLSRAREHIAERGLTDVIETRLSDGFAALRYGEAGTAVLAGMGGRLMRRLIAEGRPVERNISTLVLQPQSEVCALRTFLRESGWLIADERMVCEDGKFYPMLRAVYDEGSSDIPGAAAERTAAEHAAADAVSIGGAGSTAEMQRVRDRFGPVLLARRDEVLRQYLAREYQEKRGIYERLLKRPRDHGARVGELAAELADIGSAIALCAAEDAGNDAVR